MSGDGLDVSRLWSAAQRTRLALSQIAEPGDGDLGALIRELGLQDAAAVVRGSVAPPGDAARWRSALARWSPRLSRVDLVEQAARAQRSGAQLVTPEDADWPARVDDLGDHAPLCLWVRGDTRLLSSERAAAVVGARAASGYGVHVAADVAGDLAQAGVTIVSGAAYGIDAAAHRAALGVGGATVAVLAGGADRVYPAAHANLLATIAAEGAVVAEVPLGSDPSRWRFLLRNRVIAALSHATIVIEAGWRSGSLNTAGHAGTLGRPIGAVPGPVTSSSSAGCHRLLREYDAVCITGAEDVLEVLPEHRDTIPSPAGHRSAAQDPMERVADALSTRSIRSVEDLAARSGLSVEQAEAALGLLALDERAVRDGAGWRGGRR